MAQIQGVHKSVMKADVNNILGTLVLNHPELKVCEPQIMKAFEVLRDAFDIGGTLYLAGNGGSAADSEHIVGELMKSFHIRRPIKKELALTLREMFGGMGEDLSRRLDAGLRAVSLPSFMALSSAITNDVDGDLIFAQPFSVLANNKDVLLGISTSGNSLNVINALMVAKAIGITTIGLCGRNPCKMDELCGVVIHAPAVETYRIQEYHLPIYHALCSMLEAHYWGE